MKLYLLVVLLPCIWAVDVETLVCPDGNMCDVGKTCCEKSAGSFECCDIEEEERQNKKLVPTSYIQSYMQVMKSADCNGTMCSDEWCCEHSKAKCCAANSCCPEGFGCCGTNAPNLWCCKTNQRCAKSFMYCVAGTTALSPAFLSMIAIFLLAVTLKHF